MSSAPSQEKMVKPHEIELSDEAALNAKVAADEPVEVRMAFEYYFQLGDERSLKKTAKHVGRHEVTVEGWSSKYRWSARVRERERQSAEYLIMLQSAKKEAETKRKHLTLVDAAIVKWGKLLVNDKIRLKTVGDLKQLVELRKEIASIPDKAPNVAQIGGTSTTIDLRLRNMPEDDLKLFLLNTMQSIKRVIDRPKLGARSQPVKQTVDVDLSITRASTPEGPDLSSADDDDDILDVESIDIGFDDDLKV